MPKGREKALEFNERNSLVDVIPILKPLLPKTESYLRYLKEMDYNRWYSNFGPLVGLFEERLKDLFKSGQHLTTLCNGTLALMLGLKALGGSKKGLVLMPSWTFAASAQAVEAAGFEPYFLDVDFETWMISPNRVKEALKKLSEPVAAVMPVVPFGASFDASLWDAFRQETGIPVLIDAAASLTDGGSAETPVMISLHATKILGIGEGAVLLSSNKELIETVKSMATFGFSGQRVARHFGINAKLPEISAAVGLGMLDELPKALQEWQGRADLYRKAFERIQGAKLQQGFGETWIGSMLNIVLDGPHGDDVQRNLLERGIETRRWWGKGCHREPHFLRTRGETLKTTEHLGECVLGLPFYRDLDDEQILFICKCLDEIFCQERALAS